MKSISISLITLLIFSAASLANQKIDSFSKAKRLLERQIYNNHRTSLYCGATFDVNKNVTAPIGFTTSKYMKRAKKIEWEHISAC